MLSGYAGGDRSTAEYETVSGGDTGHAESVEIVYDPSQVSYGQILQIYKMRYTPKPGSPVIDAGDPAGGAGNDVGAIGAGMPNAADIAHWCSKAWKPPGVMRAALFGPLGARSSPQAS